MTVLLVMIIMPIISGFALMKLWLWFIAPIFDMQPLRIPEAIGLMFVFMFIQHGKDEKSDKSFWDQLLSKIGEFIGKVIFVLLASWIVQLFI